MEEEILEAAKRFRKWKKSTKGRGTNIPDIFWDEFKNIYTKHKKEDLYKILGVTKYSWDKKILGKTYATTKAKKKPFVLLPAQPKVVKELPPLMKLKLKNGTEITVYQ